MKKTRAAHARHLISHKVYRSHIAACLMTFHLIFSYCWFSSSPRSALSINKNLTSIPKNSPRRYKQRPNKPPTSVALFPSARGTSSLGSAWREEFRFFCDGQDERRRHSRSPTRILARCRGAGAGPARLHRVAAHGNSACFSGN